MSSQRNRKKLEALAEELAKEIHTEEDLNALSRQLLKLAVERALQAELDDHLGYKKYARRQSGNSRNGSSAKTLKGQMGEVEIATPRDRNSTFEPQLIRKGQTRLTAMDDQILGDHGGGSGAGVGGVRSTMG
jgi:transposase-like protein